MMVLITFISGMIKLSLNVYFIYIYILYSIYYIIFIDIFIYTYNLINICNVIMLIEILQNSNTNIYKKLIVSYLNS